ncbi:hypothetical protein ScPMuIL_001355 [Solemya velum]
MALTSADIEQMDMPFDLADCYARFSQKTNIRSTVAQAINWFCRQEFMLKTASERGALVNMTVSGLDYVKRLSRLGPARVKRQSAQETTTPVYRVRREYRMLSDEERRAYHRAINVLKTDTSAEPNKYDAIASFHTGITAISAHGGCNFEGWHRVYLYIYENALREVLPGFTLPYWDSRLDFYMEDPTESILWTDDFLGNGDGVVTSGPFANWATPAGPLTRNVGNDGPLFSHEDVINVTSRFRMADICGDEAPIEYDLEFKHGGGHRFVDGQMGMIETSAYEPAFYMHHVFVDYVWELFRENQDRLSPKLRERIPRPGELMGFGELLVIDGLRNDFTDDIIQYAPPPTCSVSYPDCGSIYLKCERWRGQPICISRTPEEVRVARELIAAANRRRNNNLTGFSGAGLSNPNNPTIGFPNNNLGFRNPRFPPVTNPGIGGQLNLGADISFSLDGGIQINFGGSAQIDNLSCGTPVKKERLNKPHQNTFCVNGKSDTTEWVYVPVKVIYQRPPNYKKYSSFPVEKGQPNMNNDIYSPSAYHNVHKYLHDGNPASYSTCKTTNSGAGEVYLQSDGINYQGSYKEYAVVDHRLAVSMSIAYVAVKNPKVGVSKAFISASDSCGRLCHTSCRVPGSNPTEYRPCSGAITVNSKTPKMFGTDFGNALLEVWNFPETTDCPHFIPDNFFMAVFCDYHDDWPWEMGVPSAPHSIKVDAHDHGSPKPGLSPNLPAQSKKVAGCDLGQGCQVYGECGRCTDNSYHACVGTCGMFARCFYGRYFIQACTENKRYDAATKLCVPATCNDNIVLPVSRQTKTRSGLSVSMIERARSATAGLGCDLGQGCQVYGECGRCTDNSYHACVGTCGMFARCFYGRYFIQACTENKRYDAATKLCVPATCNDNIVLPVSRQTKTRSGYLFQ